MTRPTIPDLARAAGVSVSTVNRVLSGSGKVRAATMQRVLDAAEEIRFYGIGALQSRAAQARPKDRFAVLLQQPGRQFYQTVARHIARAAEAVSDREVSVDIRYMPDLSPDRIAAQILDHGTGADGLAVVTAEHPLVRAAVERVSAGGTPVLALVAPLNAQANVGYVGLDHWKVGRTAAWAFDHICKAPGKIGILVGNHRYRNHDMNESGFRSYFREHGHGFTLLEPRLTFESAAVAREMTEALLAEHPDLAGLYLAGGGITGTIAALRDSGRAGQIVTVGYDLIDATRSALIDGTVTFLISHPFEALGRATIASMIRARTAGADAGSQRVILDFELYTRENL